jgi:hypothetical protein
MLTSAGRRASWRADTWDCSVWTCEIHWSRWGWALPESLATLMPIL